MIEETLRTLSLLDGSWSGAGAGRYPTIDSFEYRERLRFELDTSYPMLHYEQRTWLQPTGEASHWESGFLRILDDGTIEISNSQDSGRVEVLRGRLAEPDGSSVELRLNLDSVVLDHDPRLVRTRRALTLDRGILRYVVHMATRTTPQPELMHHLEARLERED